MNRLEIERLIRQPKESAKIDFKLEMYKLYEPKPMVQSNIQQWTDKKEQQWAELVKDVLSLTNGNIGTAKEIAYLIIGVDDKLKPDSTLNIKNVIQVPNRTEIYQKVISYCYPRLPDLQCETLFFEGKNILIISIPPSPYIHRLSKPLKTPKREFSTHTLLVRRGDGEEIYEASPVEQELIAKEKKEFLNYSSSRQESELMLLKSVKEEITIRLKQSLYNSTLINLRKELKPEEVKRPWDAEIKIGQQSPKSISETTTIYEIFNSEEIAGKLLILGKPGTGKTTILLELADYLIKIAEDEPSYPIPVLFNLSNWKSNKQTIYDWLLSELNSKHGVRTGIAEGIINDRKILPMLDGLDELDSSRQEFCVQSINQFLKSEYRPQHLVVCSRNEEYSHYTTRLNLNAAIYLKELTEDQINQYLRQIGSLNLWILIKANKVVLDLVKLPLFLNIFVLVYQDKLKKLWDNLNAEKWDVVNAEEWDKMPSLESFSIQTLLDNYVERMLLREESNRLYLTKYKPPSPEQTKKWLTWIAKQLTEESQTEFSLGNIRPSCLKTKFQKYIYCCTFILAACLVSGFIGFIFIKITFGLYSGLVIGVFFTFLSAINFIASSSFTSKPVPSHLLKFSGMKKYIYDFLVKIAEYNFNFKDYIPPSLYLSWSWKKTLKAITKTNNLILYSGLLIMLISSHQSIISILITSIIMLLIKLLMAGMGLFDTPDIKMYTQFNQGIVHSIRNSVFSGLVICSTFIFLFWANKILKTNIITAFILIIGLLIGVFYWYAAGGAFCIQHFTVRLLLFSSDYIPWNYSQFLNYCSERLLLQRVGGRYLFIHKIFQDYFAQIQLKDINNENTRLSNHNK